MTITEPTQRNIPCTFTFAYSCLTRTNVCGLWVYTVVVINAVVLDDGYGGVGGSGGSGGGGGGRGDDTVVFITVVSCLSRLHLQGYKDTRIFANDIYMLSLIHISEPTRPP